MTTTSAYVDEVLRKFITRHEGQYLDHSHVYGPQAPDLIEHYLTELLGRPWQFRAGLASRLWDDAAGAMKDFERVERGAPLRAGDVLVFDAKLGGPGTVGIYVRPGSRVGSVQMFTQNPGPAKVIDILVDGTLNQLLGAWRLTAGAECRIMADKFAAQLYAEPSGAAPVDPWIAEQQQAMNPQPLEVIYDDAVPRGQVILMQNAPTNPDSPSYGHVEIVTGKQARHYRRQTWIARLKALFGRGPE